MVIGYALRRQLDRFDKTGACSLGWSNQNPCHIGRSTLWKGFSIDSHRMVRTGQDKVNAF
jgi:hypothetical protein